MSNDVTQRVLAVIAKTQRIPPEKITADSTFEELGLDSLDSVNILFALEEGEIRSVRQMIEGIEKLVAASGGTA